MRSPTTSKGWGLAAVFLLAAVLGCHPPPSAPAEDPPEVVVGERLFLETRFAWFFAAAIDEGGDDALEDVVRHHVTTSAAVRAGAVRNGAPELNRVALIDADATSLTAFLRALNEDYD